MRDPLSDNVENETYLLLLYLSSVSVHLDDSQTANLFRFSRRRENEEKQKNGIPEHGRERPTSLLTLTENRIIRDINYCLYTNAYEIGFNLFYLDVV